MMTESVIANAIVAWIGIVLIFGRVLYYQEGIRTGDISWPNVDPMPSIAAFRSALAESKRSWRSFVTLGRAAQAGGFLLATGVVSVAVALMIHPAIGIGLAIAYLFQTAVDIYQWVSVDLGLMRAKWGWWLRNTRAPG